MRSLSQLFATTLLLAHVQHFACHAEEPRAEISSDRITLPFAYSPTAHNPMAAFTKIFGQIRDRARREARDKNYEPDVSSTPYRDGRWLLISAITPRRGVFYWVPAGPFGGPGTTQTIMPARDNLSVCRVTIPWATFPGGPIVPGLYWAGFAFPEPDCSTPPVIDTSGLAKWRHNDAKATYTIIASSADGKLRGWLVRQAHDEQPFNASSAVPVIVDKEDIVVNATPVATYGWTGSHVKTRSGREFFAFPDGIDRVDYNRDIGCLIEGVKWKQSATGNGSSNAMRDGEKICGILVQQYRSSEMKRLEKDALSQPIKAVPNGKN